MSKAISIVMIIWLSLFALGTWSQADSIDREFVESQVNIAERFINGDALDRGVIFGTALGTIEMHNMLHKALGNPAECVLTVGEINDLGEEAARDTLAMRYPALSMRSMVVMSVDQRCAKQTGASLSEALYLE